MWTEADAIDVRDAAALGLEEVAGEDDSPVEVTGAAEPSVPEDPSELGWEPVLADDLTDGLDESLWSVIDDGRTRRADAVSVEPDHPDGYLTITAYSEPDDNGTLKHYTGAVTSNGVPSEHFRTDGFVGTYGYIESRIKFSNETGTHSAFWTLGSDFSPFADPATSGLEIDIAEHVHPDVAVP